MFSHMSGEGSSMRSNLPKLTLLAGVILTCSGCLGDAGKEIGAGVNEAGKHVEAGIKGAAETIGGRIEGIDVSLRDFIVLAEYESGEWRSLAPKMVDLFEKTGHELLARDVQTLL